MEYGTGAIMAVPAPRRAGLRLRAEVRPPTSSGSSPRQGRTPTRRWPRPGPTPRRTCWSTRGPSTAGRARGRTRRNHRWLESQGAGDGVRPVPAARLVHLPAALLGPADPDHLLRRLRRRCRCPRRTCRSCCRKSTTSAPTIPGVSPLARARGVVLRALPELRQRGAARDRRLRHLPRLGLVLPALPEHRVRRPAVRPGAHQEVVPGGRPTSAATSTRCCTCSTPASSRWCSTTWGTCSSRSRSPRFRAHGLIVKDGAKMSKSRGNVVIPDEYIAQLGRRHLPDVPDVPGAVPGGRRLPRLRASADRGGSWTRSGTWSASASRSPSPARRSTRPSWSSGTRRSRRSPRRWRR